MPPLEPEGAPKRGKQEDLRKKPKGLSNMFSIFTKGRKKKGQPSSAKAEGKPESGPRRGDPLPTGRLGALLGLGFHVRAGQGLARLGLSERLAH